MQTRLVAKDIYRPQFVKWFSKALQRRLQHGRQPVICGVAIRNERFVSHNSNSPFLIMPVAAKIFRLGVRRLAGALVTRGPRLRVSRGKAASSRRTPSYTVRQCLK